MSELELDDLGHTLGFRWPSKALEIHVAKFKESSRGTHAEVTVKVGQPGYAKILTQGSMNLTSVGTKSSWAKILTPRYGEVDWHAILETVCVRTLRHFREGEPLLELKFDLPWSVVPFALSPLVYDQYTTILYGAGGIGKSLLALLTAMLYDGYQAHAHLLPSQPDSRALYLDWESDSRDILSRAQQIRSSLALIGQPFYRRCLMPLADDLTPIQRMIADNHIRYVVVDSLAPACGTDLFSPETAIRFIGALRSLKVSALVLAHQAKNQDEDRSTSIYGSVFFGNLARSIWEMRKVQDVGANSLQAGLFHRKCNLGRLHPPLGFAMTFRDSQIHIEPSDVQDSAELSKGLSDTERVKAALKQLGSGTAQQIATAAGVKVESTRTFLCRGVKAHWAESTDKQGSELLYNYRSVITDV